MEKKEIITVKEAADLLEISLSRIYVLIKQNRLPATKFGNAWLIREADLEAVKERNPGRPKKPSE